MHCLTDKNLSEKNGGIMKFLTILLIVTNIITANAFSSNLRKVTLFDSKRIMSDFVQSLYNDGEYLWIGTYNGLSLYSNGRVIKNLYNDYNIVKSNLFSKKTGNSFLIDNRINDIEKISSKIYIATDGGLSVYDYEENEWSSIDTNNSILESDYIQSIASEGTRLWIGTADSGLYVWDTSGGNWQKIGATGPQGSIFGSFDGKNITRVVSAPEKNLLFVGTMDKGLFVSQDGRWRNITTKYPSNSFLPSDRILSMHFFRDKLYIGTNRGLVIYDNDNFTLINERHGLRNAVILSINDDGEHIFMGTARGLYKLNQGEGTPARMLEGENFRILDIAVYNKKLFLATQNFGVAVSNYQ